MKNIYFVAPYVSEHTRRNMLCAPSSITYSNYLINAFARLEGINLTVLSLCTSRDRVYMSKEEVDIKNYKEVYFRSLPSNWGSLFIRISQIWLYVQIFIYLLSNTQKEDTVVLYHDYGLSYFYKLFRKYIHSRFVFLVGEVFNAVYDRGDASINKECTRLSIADAYIYANDIMPEIFKFNKVYGVCYGNYLYRDLQKTRDDTIHILYAGKISTGIINDAFIALDVIKYLPVGYVMHIAGYGEASDIDEMKKGVDTINNETGAIRVTYEGNLRGNEYESLLAKCHIGLCTRTLRNDLSNYCFPSKTLVYLTHDILPICPPIDILLRSKVSSTIAFVDGNLTQKSIADAIMHNCYKIKDYNNKKMMDNLDIQFISQLKNII